MIPKARRHLIHHLLNLIPSANKLPSPLLVLFLSQDPSVVSRHSVLVCILSFVIILGSFFVATVISEVMTSPQLTELFAPGGGSNIKMEVDARCDMVCKPAEERNEEREEGNCNCMYDVYFRWFWDRS